MKKLFLCSLVLLLGVSAVFAAPFSPTPMKLTAASKIFYAFDGSNLTIPVNVSGTPANAVLLIFTQDKASSISKVQNGFLGWHYVNKIDTCLYVSSFNDFAKGNNAFVWDGKDENGNAVTADEYTYYIWAYDNQSQKLMATNQVGFGWETRAIIQTHDKDGNVLAKPVIYDSPIYNVEGAPEDQAKVTRNKWAIGGDPTDATLKETCSYMTWIENGSLALDPTDHTNFFTQAVRPLALQHYTWKMKWVPNGDAVIDTNWGDDGQLVYTVGGKGGYHSGPMSDGQDYLFCTAGDLFGVGLTSEIVYINIADGTVAKRLDVSDWWVDMNDKDAGGQAAGGPSDLDFKHGVLIASSHSSCMDQMINPYADSDDEATLWVNQNGDVTGDHNFEENALRPWVCNDYNVGPYKYSAFFDDNLFSTFPAYDMGSVSFGLYAPDGTGLGYHAFSGETANFKAGNRYVDVGSAYDGMYMDNASAAENTAGWWWVGHDSIKGTITNQVGVADAAPAAFTVAQNVPNPFNPTTTISFTLAKAGKTTVEVYNVAGQKVDTLVNGSLKAGSHSVNWNASKFSAGVYFYTVKSGSFSKTVKMTLLK